MGSTKEIQTRMKSIQDTMKITNAMYMISSSKMQKAKRILSDTEPYYYNMQAAISRISAALIPMLINLLPSKMLRLLACVFAAVVF